MTEEEMDARLQAVKDQVGDLTFEDAEGILMTAAFDAAITHQLYHKGRASQTAVEQHLIGCFRAFLKANPLPGPAKQH